MYFSYYAYLVLVIAAVFLLTGLAVYAWMQRHVRLARTFAATMIILAAFSFFNLLIIVTPTPTLTLFVARIGYISVVPVPVAWLTFVLHYTGQQQWLTWRRFILLSLIPFFTFVATQVDPLFPLIWSEYHLVPVGSLLLVDVTFGLGMWVFLIYSYLVMLVTILLLVAYAWAAPILHRRRTIALIVAILLPALVNVLYVVGEVWPPHVDITPFGFMLAGWVMSWSVFRYRLLDLEPIARAALVEEMQEGLVVVDRWHCVVDTNPAARAMLGVTLAASRQVPIAQLLPDWPEAVGEENGRFHFTFAINPDKIIEVSASCLHDQQGDLSGWLAILHDRTDQEKAEAQLRRRALELEAMVLVSQSVRTAQTIADLLPAVLAQTAEVLSTSFASIYLCRPDSDVLELRASHPPDFPMVGLQHKLGRGITGHVAATGEVYMTENLLLDTKAAFLPAEKKLMAQTLLRAQLSLPLRLRSHTLGVMHLGFAEQRPFRDDEIRLATIVADIVANAIDRLLVIENLEQKVTARTEKIEAEQKKLDLILNNVQDAIVLFDRKMGIDYVNRAFAELTGYALPDLRGKYTLDNWMQFMPPAEREGLKIALDAGRSWQGELPFTSRNGRSYDAAIIISPVQDTHGRVTGYISSHRDVTWRRELERARRQFMANVSHQLRTPVTNIKLYTELMQMGRAEEKQAHYMQVLLEQSERLEHLVQDIIEMTDLDSGEALPQRLPVNWMDVTQSVLSQFEYRAEAADLRLIMEPIPEMLPLVLGDVRRLSQALAELLANAISFSLAGGEIRVRVYTALVGQRHWVAVGVQDTGPGVDEAERDRIFERFYRGSLAAAGHIPGTGLGLSIVASIVKAHSGHVTVEGGPDGTGTLFTLWFPAAVDETAVLTE